MNYCGEETSVEIYQTNKMSDSAEEMDNAPDIEQVLIKSEPVDFSVENEDNKNFMIEKCFLEDNMLESSIKNPVQIKVEDKDDEQQKFSANSTDLNITEQVQVKIEDELDKNYMKREINEEFIIKEESSNVSKLLKHNQTGEHRNKEEISRFTCDVCQKTFKYPSTLTRHQLTHSDAKPHECDVCQKTFRLIDQLKAHKHVHNDERLHECDVCQKTYGHISNLRAHKRLHNQKRHKCDVCQKTFNYLSNLNTHKLLHTDEKPYVCDVCQKRFKQINNLRSHKLTHTGDKPHSCDVC